MPCRVWVWEFGSRASKGEIKKANIPHAAAHFMRQDVGNKQKQHVQMRPSDNQIKEIADNLDCGMKCYFNVKTGELKTIINTDKWDLAEEEAWEEDINEIEENQNEHIEFHGMSTHESFNLMVDFADYVDDLKLKERLIRGLNKPKPFRNFKWEIDNSGEYRQVWFDFKKVRYISFVQKQIDLESIE